MLPLDSPPHDTEYAGLQMGYDNTPAPLNVLFQNPNLDELPSRRSILKEAIVYGSKIVASPRHLP